MRPLGPDSMFLATATGFVGTTLLGFGAELVPFISPRMVGTGHSEAALFFGEWLFNFGLPGLLIMVPVAGTAMRGLDQLLARAMCLPLDSRSAIVRYTTALVATAGVMDLMWVGTFGYTSRIVFRLLILAALFAVFAGGQSQHCLDSAPQCGCPVGIDSERTAFDPLGANSIAAAVRSITFSATANSAGIKEET
jgi:hypothetical protein